MQTKLEGIVTQGDKKFVFTLQAFLANSIDDLLMEKVEFYQKFAVIPAFPHLEFEIISLPEEAETAHLHIHKVDDRRFLCWTHRIADLNEASSILQTWCLGCVYTILTGIPFENYLKSEKVRNHSDNFAIELLKEFDLLFEWGSLPINQIIQKTESELLEVLNPNTNKELCEDTSV